MGKWRHFSDEEAAGLADGLMFKLDRARDFFGDRILITRGLSTVAENKAVGGVPDSAHLAGLAVDVACVDPALQARLAWAMGCAGFFRIGVYNRHLHVDVDTSKPLPAYWTGVDR